MRRRARSEDRAYVLSLNGAIRNLETAIDNRERLAHLGLGDTERRVRIESVPTHYRVEPFLTEETAERPPLGGRAVEKRPRLPRPPISNPLDDPQQTNTARGAHRPMTSP